MKLKLSQSRLSPSPLRTNVLVVRLEGLLWAMGARVAASEILLQVHFYDSRVVIETASIKADKQGLGLVKRRKFSLMGQEMLVLLAQLAHNLVVWAKGWLAELPPELESFGVQRFVRDFFAIAGAGIFHSGRLVKVQLKQRNRLARRFHKPLEPPPKPF